MMEGWIKMNLGSLTSTQKGYAFKSNWYQDNGVAIARVSDFTENSISEDNLLYVSEEIAKDYSKYKLKRRDIIIQTVGSGPNNPASIVGKVINVPENLNEALLNQNAVKLLPNDLIDNRFLYYRLKDEHFKYYCLNHSKGGANQMSITLDSIRRFEFLLPPLPTQRKIASILSAYDDLIENNLNRIKLLEEKAQLTYEEWFVRMKFPGHETAVFDEESGLPEGWERKKIGNVCTVSGGGTPSKAISDYWDKGTITWFSPTDLSKSRALIQLDSESKITELGLQKSSAKLLQANSFMMTSRATIGLFGIIDKPFSTNQGFINVTPNENFEKEYLIYNFKDNIQLFINYATGATFLEISKSVFKKIKINWPTSSMIASFNEIVSPIHEEMLALTKQNHLLKEARDILLPRLMTGMIDVERLNIQELENTK